MDHNQIIDHFLQLNCTRIARLSTLVTAPQQHFFNLLPFLIHTNIAGLPGYTSQDSPVGIIDYQADDQTINDARRLSPGLKYKHHAIRHYAVSSLYLINPYGLLNIPKQPAFTLYLVYTDLTDAQYQALEKKLTLLRRWAQDFEIDLTCNFLAQQTLTDSTLSAKQREQLYLNGINLGGALPLWYLVPPDTDYHAAVASVEQQYNRRLLLDFGPTIIDSPQTLIEDTTDLLDQGLEYGLMQTLSMLYQQSQLNNYPNVPPLSEQAKKVLYQGESEPLAMDCKILQLHHLEHTNSDPAITRTARQSLYIQAQEALSKRVSQPKYPWRRDYFKQLCGSWSWLNYEFQMLDQRDTAKYQQCQDEHRQTQALFAGLSTTIRQFAKQQHCPVQPQQKLIDKKLQDYRDPSPYIISKLPTGLVAKSPEDKIHLYRFHVDDDWKLSLIALTVPNQNPLYQHPSLLHVLAWAVHNGLLITSTRLMIADKTESMTINTIVSLVRQLCRSPLATRAKLDKNARSQPAKLSQLMLFANLTRPTNDNATKSATQLSSRYNDPFNYANRGASLLNSLDGLLCSTWGEWHTFHHEGKAAPLTLFESLIPWWLAGKTSITPFFWCPPDVYAKLIAERIQRLYSVVSTHYFENEVGDYLMLLADDLYQLHWQPSGFDVTVFAQADLDAALGHRKTAFSMTKVDTALDPSGFYQQLLSCQHQGFTSLIIQTQTRSMSIHVIDNNGNLFSQYNIQLTPVTAISHYLRFLSAIEVQAIRCFEIKQQADQQWALAPITQLQASTKQGYLPVIVQMANITENARCTIHCGPKKFSGTANNPVLFEQVSTFILQLRKQHQPYPLYINEIRFPASQNADTADYLLHKQRLEKLLNHD